jgi:hypothetical protein
MDSFSLTYAFPKFSVIPEPGGAGSKDRGYPAVVRQ